MSSLVNRIKANALINQNLQVLDAHQCQVTHFQALNLDTQFPLNECILIQVEFLRNKIWLATHSFSLFNVIDRTTLLLHINP